MHHGVRARPGRRAERVSTASLALSAAHRNRRRVSRPHARGIQPSVPRRTRQPCAGAVDRDPVLGNVQTEAVQAWRLYGFADAGEGDAWVQTVVHLPQFLARTCLSYCEFLELWKSGFVPFYSSGDERIRDFPECEPCCLDAYRIAFPGERDAAAAGLIKLAVFVRLWRILKRECCDGYSFDELRDICDVLQLFKGGALNPDFIRQLAALKLLCDHFGLPLQDRADPPAPGATGADRTALLALW